MYKLYICAAIFVLLSAFKCFAPQHGEQLRQQVANVIDSNDDYVQIVETLGRRLAETGLKEELIKVLNMAEEFELKQTFSQNDGESK